MIIKKRSEIAKTVLLLADMDDFNALVQENDIVILDCYAMWCPPCKAAAPVFGSMSLEYENVVFAKVDVDKARALAKHLDISAMPTFKVWKNGVEVGTQRGWSESNVRALIEAHGGRKVVAVPSAEAVGSSKEK